MNPFNRLRSFIADAFDWFIDDAFDWFIDFSRKYGDQAIVLGMTIGAAFGAAALLLKAAGLYGLALALAWVSAAGWTVTVLPMVLLILLLPFFLIGFLVSWCRDKLYWSRRFCPKCKHYTREAGHAVCAKCESPPSEEISSDQNAEKKPATTLNDDWERYGPKK